MKKHLLQIFITTMFIAGCKKNNISSVSLPETKKSEIKTIYKEIASVILSSARDNRSFRTVAYKECYKQKFGDYYVKLDELIAQNSEYNYWNEKTVIKLQNLQKEIKILGRNDVTVFIPSMEVHPEKATGTTIAQATPGGGEVEPVGVIAEEYSEPSQTCPGYIVENNGVLTFYQTIDESYAWENDVWVIGEEENCSPENMVAAPEDTEIFQYTRVDGGEERGGIVKVTDWSQVEPWILGKVEFRMIVYKGAGTNANSIFDMGFGKWRRKNFDNVYKDFNVFLYNWNKSVVGDWTTEKWIEEDGGFNATIGFSISIKPDSAANGLTLSANVSLPIKNLDDDLGLSMIQFTDSKTTEYYQSGIQIKRKY